MRTPISDMIDLAELPPTVLTPERRAAVGVVLAVHQADGNRGTKTWDYLTARLAVAQRSAADTTSLYGALSEGMRKVTDIHITNDLLEQLPELLAADALPAVATPTDRAVVITLTRLVVTVNKNVRNQPELQFGTEEK